MGTITPMGMITRIFIVIITIMVTMDTVITDMIIALIITTIETAEIPACSTAAPTRQSRRSPA